MTSAGRTRVGKYELGRTLGEGTFAKVKFAKNVETGEGVAIKILDKEKILRHRMVGQIKREISTMKLVRHPNVIRMYEVMASKTKIYIVMEFVTGGELFSKIEDGKLYTTCGTPNYVAPEVVKHKGYDGAKADLWSCGVILYILMAGFLPFEDSNLMSLYKKIFKADFSCPPWFSTNAKKLIQRILDPDPLTRITIQQVIENDWFKKDYQPPHFETADINLDDLDAIFNESRELSEMVIEKREEKPVVMNAFELISKSQGFNLSTLFEKQMGCVGREIRFTSKLPADEILSKIESAAKPLGFSVKKQNYKIKLEGEKPGRKGHLAIATEVFEVAPSLHMVELRKSNGDTFEFHKFYETVTMGLKDIISKTHVETSGSRRT
ncbi:CBL-interacting protein kinase 23-like isoform X2 [Curcuma longa]|uniref:CBL-interacting protein kinase 23-like isoform X2 n=1 Tax=Curcuma longa TaxID=136217 RepID=UPI003D9E709C